MSNSRQPEPVASADGFYGDPLMAPMPSMPLRPRQSIDDRDRDRDHDRRYASGAGSQVRSGAGSGSAPGYPPGQSESGFPGGGSSASRGMMPMQMSMPGSNPGSGVGTPTRSPRRHGHRSPRSGNRSTDETPSPSPGRRRHHRKGRNPNKPIGWGKRHTMAVMGFTGFALAYMMRFNLALVIVKMVKPYKNDEDDETKENYTAYCKAPDGDNHTDKEAEGELDWSPTEIGLLLGAFFWGYVVTQIPGGIVAGRLGGKMPMGVGMLVSAAMSYLIPCTSRTNIAMVMYCRIIQGLAQGILFPAFQELLAAWSPPEERTLLTGIVFAGPQFGAALSMIMSGYLAESSWGWPSVFYVTATIAVIWYLIWLYVGASNPLEHTSISEAERDYIMKSIGETKSTKAVPTPWRAIMRSRIVWVLCMAEFCHTWGFYSLLLELPTYLKTVLHFDMESNAWISAAPEIAMWIVSFVVTFAADTITKRKLAQIITIRKGAHIIAEVGAGVCLICAALVGCDRLAVIFLLTLAVGLSGAVVASYQPNQQEIACNHAGIIAGIINTVGNISGFFAPIVAVAVAKHSRNPSDWAPFFYLAAALNLFSAGMYSIFATVEEQPWNRPQEPELEPDDKGKDNLPANANVNANVNSNANINAIIITDVQIKNKKKKHAAKDLKDLDQQQLQMYQK